MTKGKLFEKAWRLGFKGDFYLVDEIYHPDYKSFDFRTGIYANLEDDKVIVSTVDEECTYGSYEIIYENDEFVCLYKYVKSQLEGENKPSFDGFHARHQLQGRENNKTENYGTRLRF